MLRHRLIFGLSLATLVVVIYLTDAYLGGLTGRPALEITPWRVDVSPWIFEGGLSTLFAVLVTALTVHELLAVARARGYRPFGVLAQVFSIGLALGPYAGHHLSPIFGRNDEAWGMMWLAGALALAFLVQAVRWRTEQALVNLSSTLFVIYYAGGLVGFLTKLRMEVGGRAGAIVLLFSIFLIKITDTGAFFVGRSFGRHKLIEWLSPKKTWEGLAGGLAAAVLASLAIGSYLNFQGIVPMSAGRLTYPWGLIVLGLLMGLVSVAGDLCASLLKRDAAIKDSSSLIPGLGGTLDVLDSILLTAPAAWFFWTRLAGLGSVGGP
ncbi:MAG: hypothetical protein CHACPFDD_01437 [Phycisphaerae bacterium]|nr:hypothetical protein [Phycisphaerae bacterium]